MGLVEDDLVHALPCQLFVSMSIQLTGQWEPDVEWGVPKTLVDGEGLCMMLQCSVTVANWILSKYSTWHGRVVVAMWHDLGCSSTL